MGGTCSAYGWEESVQGFGPENQRERGHFGDLRRRWEDNIKMDLQEVECGGMDWIELAQIRDRWRAFVNVVMNIWVP